MPSSSGIAMMLETSAGSGNYEMTTRSEWPTEGYVFNVNLSKCENGSELSWDNENKKVLMSGNKSDKCYVYFDVYVKPTIANTCSSGKNLATCIKTFGDKGSSVSNIYYHDASLTNGAGDNSYRYAGASDQVNNYVNQIMQQVHYQVQMEIIKKNILKILQIIKEIIQPIQQHIHGIIKTILQ